MCDPDGQSLKAYRCDGQGKVDGGSCEVDVQKGVATSEKGACDVSMHYSC